MSLNHVIILLIILCNLAGSFLNFEILVYNEEAIIVICFVLFLSFAYKTIGESIAMDLDDRSSKIRDELAKSTNVWKTMQSNVLISWQLVSRLLHEIEYFFQWSESEVLDMAVISMDSLYDSVNDSMIQRLNFLLIDESSYNTTVRSDLSQNFFMYLNGSEGLRALKIVKHSLMRANHLLAVKDGRLPITKLKQAGLSQVSSSKLSFARSVIVSNQMMAKLLKSRV